MNYVLNTELRELFENNSITKEGLEYLMAERIGFAFNRKIISIPENVPMGGLRCVQYPNEFAQYLNFMLALDINSYMEIGVDRGGTFFVTDSFLRATNQNFGKSYAIDIRKKIIRWDEYKEQNNVEFIQCDSKKMTPIDVDWCLIDGDHTYEGAKADFINMKVHARYIAFHDIDILHRKTNVKKLWEELKPQYEHWEFRNEDARFPTPVGIGVIKVKE